MHNEFIQKLPITYKKHFALVFFFLVLFTCFTQTFGTSSTDTSSLTIYSNNALTMDFESGNVLLEKNAYAKVYPASTTKILTAILAIEYLDLEKKTVVSAKAINSTPYGSSIIYLKAGEVISNKDVLYGLLLKSGNDAANVLAENVSGSIPKFVEIMNKKLKEIGCNDTHFTNSHGFHDVNHYTTAYDMAKLMRYAMQNETFRQIVETKEYIIPATNKTEERNYYNTNKMFNNVYSMMYYEYNLGGKTGYTEEARGTYVGYAKKDDKLIISSVFDGSQSVVLKGIKNEARFLDSITLLNYSFENFEKSKVLAQDEFTFNVIDKNTRKEFTIKLDTDKYALVSKDFNTSTKSYNLNVDFNKLNSSNITENTKVGDIKIEEKGYSLNTNNTYDLIFVNSKDYFDISLYKKYYIIIPLAIILVFNIIIISAIISKSKKDKKTYLKKIKKCK